MKSEFNEIYKCIIFYSQKKNDKPQEIIATSTEKMLIKPKDTIYCQAQKN